MNAFQRGGISRGKSRKCRIRRHSLTTLHSLPMSEKGAGSTTAGSVGIERQTTVPHGFNVRLPSAVLLIILMLRDKPAF